MNRFRVHYVKKISAGPMKGDVTHIGGITEEGENWNISATEAIERINSGTWEFYMVERFEEIQVNICTANNSETFLSTKGRGYLHNLLEDLPECSLAFQL